MTQRLIRFHAPEVNVYVSSPYYWDYYYDPVWYYSPYWRPCYSWSFGWAWGGPYWSWGWGGWYDPFWGPSWGWGGWYDPFWRPPYWHHPCRRITDRASIRVPTPAAPLPDIPVVRDVTTAVSAVRVVAVRLPICVRPTILAVSAGLRQV